MCWWPALLDLVRATGAGGQFRRLTLSPCRIRSDQPSPARPVAADEGDAVQGIAQQFGEAAVRIGTHAGIYP